MTSAAIRSLGNLIMAVALSCCGHAKSTDASKPSAVVDPPAVEPPVVDPPARAVESKPKVETRTEKNDETPLATVPLGLLKPGAEESIRKRLAAAGFLKKSTETSTQTGLRLFQAAEGLPKTGAPDRETLRKLGLNPDELFR